MKFGEFILTDGDGGVVNQFNAAHDAKSGMFSSKRGGGAASASAGSSSSEPPIQGKPNSNHFNSQYAGDVFVEALKFSKLKLMMKPRVSKGAGDSWLGDIKGSKVKEAIKALELAGFKSKGKEGKFDTFESDKQDAAVGTSKDLDGNVRTTVSIKHKPYLQR